MADVRITGRITSGHPPEACYGSTWHCHAHNVDEPARGYRWCVECGHMYLTAEELLAEHNRQIDGLGLPPETDVSRVFCCPFCIHDW